MAINYPPDDPQNGMIPPGFGRGMQGMFGGLSRGFQGGANTLNPYSNRLLGFSAGMLGGGPSDAMKGLIAGSALDRESADRKKLNEAIAGLKGQSGVLSGLNEADWNYLSAAGPEAMGDAFAAGLKGPDTPGSYDEWSLAQRNPAYAEFLKNRPAGTSVTVGGQEKAYDKKVGEGFAEDYLTMQKGARDASGTISQLDRLGSALSAPGVYTGTGGELVADLKKTASGLGIPVEGVAETDVARAISNDITLRLRNPTGGAGMPGAMSDADRKFLAAIPPGLSNTPEGNRQKLDMLKKVQERSIEVAQFANRYVQESPSGQLDAGFYQALAEWAEANPLFPEGDTPTELDALKREFGIQ